MKNKIVFLLLGIIIGLIGFILVSKKDILTKKEFVDEESVTTKVVENSTDSVVTISMVKTETVAFDEVIAERDIGTGFIISSDGLIITNKHVVADTGAKYKVIIGKDEVVEVVNIYRDPITDLAIVKVNKTGLKPVILGDSDKIKVGQTVIAIGTALGEFRSTVTRGVISGLGRGITASGQFEGSEKLDNVIQTDAAINPGNSGGPLFNSNGEVIGVNVAVSQSGQSIGFALPINIVKESIDNFKSTGQFDRPYLGVGYKLIAKQTAILNNVPAGDYIQSVNAGSPAQKAGLMVGDIVIEVDNLKLENEKNTVLSTYINRKKIGETVNLKVWRDKKEMTFTILLEKKEQ